MDALWNYILDVDASVSQDDRAKKDISKKDLQRFMDHCCHFRHYVFSIKKCGSSNCSICCPPRLPPEVFAKIHHLPDPHKDASREHYQSFDDLYGTMTSEKEHPSLTTADNKQNHGLLFNPSAQTCHNVAETVL